GVPGKRRIRFARAIEHSTRRQCHRREYEPRLRALPVIRSGELEQHPDNRRIQFTHRQRAGSDPTVAGNGTALFWGHFDGEIAAAGAIAVERQDQASVAIERCELSAVPGQYVAAVVVAESGNSEGAAVQFLELG